MEQIDLTTKAIQRIIGRMQVLKYHSPVCENVSQVFTHEMDVMSVSKAGIVFEFEVKVSRSDFLADKKKRKHTFFDPVVPEQTPNYFSYVCPKDLISISEVQWYAGLYWICENGQILIMKNPKRLHTQKHNTDRINQKINRVYSERTFLGACRLTYENNLIKQRNSSTHEHTAE